MGQYRNLQGKADDQVVKAIRELYDFVYTLKGKMEVKAPEPTPNPTPAPEAVPLVSKGLNLTLNSPLQLSSGIGSPEGKVIGNIGDLYVRQDGGAGTTLYVKESSSGAATGWMGY